MKALFKNIQGIKRVILITLLVMIAGLTIFVVSHSMCCDTEKSAVFAATFALVVALAASTYSVALVVASIAFAVAITVTFATAFVIFIFVFAVVLVNLVLTIADALDRGQNLKSPKVPRIILCEVLATTIATTVLVPYFAIGGLALCGVGVIFLFGESKLRLWLASNPPPSIRYQEIRTIVGQPHYHSAAVTSRKPIPDPWRVRLHRRLHDLYT